MSFFTEILHNNIPKFETKIEPYRKVEIIEKEPYIDEEPAKIIEQPANIRDIMPQDKKYISIIDKKVEEMKNMDSKHLENKIWLYIHKNQKFHDFSIYEENILFKDIDANKEILNNPNFINELYNIAISELPYEVFKKRILLNRIVVGTILLLMGVSGLSMASAMGIALAIETSKENKKD